MNKEKQLGICMDHSNAQLLKISDGNILLQNIESESKPKVEKVNVDTHEIHGKERHQLQSAYFKKISNIILNYEDVLLFGPTDAKRELFNLINEDPHFENIKIELRTTDKMSERQMHDYVIEFFSWD